MGIKMRYLLIALLLLFAPLAHAANEIYVDLSAGVTWTDTGGDEILDLGDTNCGDTTVVCVGAYHDWGVDPRPGLYMMVVDIDGFDTAPVVGETVEVFISESEDSTTFSGPESPVDGDPTDATGDTDRLGNLLGPFPVFVHSTTAGDNLTGVFYFTSFARYHAPIVHNAAADDLLTTSDAHTVTIYPATWQKQ